MDIKMSFSIAAHIFVQLLLILNLTDFSFAYRSTCELICLSDPSMKDLGGCALATSNIWPNDCSKLPLGRNASNNTSGKIGLKAHPIMNRRGFIKLEVIFSEIKFNYFILKYLQSDKTYSVCHSYNITSVVPESSLSLSHNCIWSDTETETEVEIKYQSYDYSYDLVNKGHYIFNLPNSHRIEENETSLNNWELFLYVDITDLSNVKVKWPAPPMNFDIQEYLLKIFYQDNNSSFSILESHHIPAEGANGQEESFQFETDLFGKFYFTVQMLHDNCTNSECFISKSPVFSVDNHYKSPLILGVISLFILLPGFLYILYSWRRFGTPPPHKIPVVLLIYKRTMDSHFRVIVALVMYLRKACHIRALIEDFDILSADSEDSSSWYQEAFTHVDSVMVISSPICMGSNKDKAYYNVDPATLRMLEEKSRDKSSSLKLFSVILPYCTKKDIPKEARNLPVFRLPEDLNSVLWFIRFGPTKSCFSKLEYLLFQSQISGGTCDYSSYGKFLREALLDADEESRRLRAMVIGEQMV